ncbi:MAG: universal stress protein [Actinomycetota bacterium]|nr:universal stress protein [Actinomycetota bacterium]
MTALIAIVAVLALAAGGVLWLRFRGKISPAPSEAASRILFPFVGSELSGAALEAALRLARAENATLVPAYLATVPLTLPLASALPRQCEAAMSILEAIEQRAARTGVAVDPRIERGRSSRHALAELIEHESFDRIVAPAATAGSDGFSADDVAWLLDHAGGEIVVFRAGRNADGARQESPTSRRA